MKIKRKSLLVLACVVVVGSAHAAESCSNSFHAAADVMMMRQNGLTLTAVLDSLDRQAKTCEVKPSCAQNVRNTRFMVSEAWDRPVAVKYADKIQAVTDYSMLVYGRCQALLNGLK